MPEEEAEKRLNDQLKQDKKQPKAEEIPEKLKKEMEQTKIKLESFKKELVKKFPFIDAVGLIPPQAAELFEEEEEIQKNEKEKFMHLVIILPESKEKEIGKVKAEAIKAVQKIKPKIWLHVHTPAGIWEMSYDAKYDMVEAISMAYPLHDKGILGALRVVAIHKNLVVRKFEKYIVSYVLAGSLSRGEATKTSDVDTFVIVDDTDVKRMSRAELRDKLRGIIWGYGAQAGEMAGVKNKLSCQIYILTEFWDAVREAHPVMFTFIRDGIPFYDKGTFMPWKLLLRMGKITGTPEAIDRFMALGERVKENVSKRLNDIATEEIYWSIITPSQGILMLYGLAPATPKETVQLMGDILYEKEKLIEKKYIEILEKIVGVYKGFEHGKIKEVSGKQIDELTKDAEDYIKRLKELVKQISEKTSERTLQTLYEDAIKMLDATLGKTENLENKFEKELVEKGRMPASSLRALQELLKAKSKKFKMGRQEAERVRKDAQVLISELTEYNQRKELLRKIAEEEKSKEKK